MVIDLQYQRVVQQTIVFPCRNGREDTVGWHEDLVQQGT